MRVALVEKPSRTGIGSYTAALAKHMPGDIDLTICRVQAWETDILGRKVGGSLTPRLLRLDPRIPDDAPVVHATSNLAFPKRANLLTIHDLNPLVLPGMMLDRVLLRSQAKRIRRLKAVITLSQHVRQEVLRKYKLDEAQVVVIPQAVDHDTFRPLGRDEKARLAAESKAAQAEAASAVEGREGRSLLYVGDWREYKGIREAVDVLAQPAFAAWRLVRVGPPPTSRWGNACRAHAQAKLGARFEDRGYVTTTQLRLLYATSTALWFPSRHEGFGLPPLEAAACATQSLCWDNDLNRDHLGGAAVYLDSLQPERIAAALDQAVARPVLPSHLRAAASRFHWETTVQRTADIYRAIAEA